MVALLVPLIKRLESLEILTPEFLTSFNRILRPSPKRAYLQGKPLNPLSLVVAQEKELKLGGINLRRKENLSKPDWEMKGHGAAEKGTTMCL